MLAAEKPQGGRADLGKNHRRRKRGGDLAADLQNGVEPVGQRQRGQCVVAIALRRLRGEMTISRSAASAVATCSSAPGIPTPAEVGRRSAASGRTRTWLPAARRPPGFSRRGGTRVGFSPQSENVGVFAQRMGKIVLKATPDAHGAASGRLRRAQATECDSADVSPLWLSACRRRAVASQARFGAT